VNDELTLGQIVLVSSWLLGTVLHFLLLRMILRRKRWVRGEGLFAVLVTAVGLWNLGRFVFVLLELLLKGQVPGLVSIGCDAIAYGGLLLIPSALVHTLVRLLLERVEADGWRASWAPSAAQSLPPPPPSRAANIVTRLGIALVYAPVLVFPEVLARAYRNPGKPGFEQLGWIIKPFAAWFAGALVLAALLSAFLARRAREPRETGFYWSMVGILVGSATLLVVIYAVGTQTIDSAGVLLQGLIVLASTIPSLMFGYYIHRHHYMEFVVRRSIFYLVLIVATVLTYVWGVSSVARFLDERMGLHHRVLEVCLILLLVFLFAPFGKALEKILTTLFFRESDVYRRVLSELIGQMGRGSAYRLSTLTRHVAMTVARTLHVEEAAIVLLDSEGHVLLSTHRVQRPEVSATHSLLAPPGSPPYVLVEDLGDDENETAAGRELDALRAEAAFAVRAEGKLSGIFFVGPKASAQPLFQEEIELCRALADQLAVSLENQRLYEEKLALERKIHETERQLSLGRFSASVAHRVKNPLSSIKAITQAMAEDMPSGDSRRADLAIVVGEVDRLTQVVNQLLDYAEPAPSDDGATEVDLAAVLSEVAVLFQHEADLTGVEIRSAFAANVPRAKGERTAVREVFGNLIQNATHAMPRGGVVAITTEYPAPAREGLEGDFALVTVTDGGTGVAPEHLERLFAPFFTTKPRGTGLGLAITRHKLEELGGRIEVESPVPEAERPPRTSGPGTRFRVWWPVFAAAVGAAETVVPADKQPAA
jgi:signal transduction histidine kinase